MRKLLAKELCKLASENPDVYLLTADLGYGVLENFQQSFPERFINVGISEQHMISMAAGLAAVGKKVFCYSINNFASYRCAEQIRNDIAYPNLDVTILSLGPGLTYDNYGFSHYGIEDINVVENLPNIKIFEPVFEESIRPILEKDGPKYIRIGNNFISNRKEYYNRNSIQEPLIVTHGQLVLDFIEEGAEKIHILEDLTFCRDNLIKNSTFIEHACGEVVIVSEHKPTLLFTSLCYIKKGTYISFQENLLSPDKTPDLATYSDREYFLMKIIDKVRLRQSSK